MDVVLGWARRPAAWVVLAVVIYLGTALKLTWPMPTHLSTQIFGQGGDAWGGIGAIDEIIDSGNVPFLPGRFDDLAAPEGRDYSYPLYIASWASSLPRYLLSLAFGSIAGWNLMVLAGFTLTGTSMFLLMRRLTGNPAAALVAGWAFAFFPWAVVRGGSHIDFMNGWLFVLMLWRALELRENPTRRNGILVGTATALCFSFTPYFVLIGGILIATVIALDLLEAWRGKDLRRHVKAWAWGMWIPPAMLAAFVLTSMTYAAQALPENNVGELYTYSARIKDFLIPIRESGLVDTTRYASDYAAGFASGERGLYLGWSVLALVLLGVVFALARRLDREQTRLVLAFAVVGLIAALFSAPPTFQALGTTIYMPSHYVYELTPAFRVMGRFVEVIMLCCAGIAGVALARLTQGRGIVATLAVTGLVGGVVVSDLWFNPQPATVNLPYNGLHTSLDDDPEPGLVAEYPLVPEITPDYRFYITQDYTGRPSLNGYRKGTFQEHRALWLSALNDPRTPGRLAALGVRWVMVNELDPYPNQFPPGEPAKGLTLERRAAGRALYLVTAKPRVGMAYPSEGFGWAERPGEQPFAWLFGGTTGEVDVESRGCALPCRGTLRFNLGTLGQPRTVRISGPGVRPRTVKVPTTGSAVSIPLTTRKERTSIRLDVTPGPQTPRQTDGTPDDRPLSIQVIDSDFIPSRK